MISQSCSPYRLSARRFEAMSTMDLIAGEARNNRTVVLDAYEKGRLTREPGDRAV